MVSFRYELNIGNLLKTSVKRNGNQEIVYSDVMRYTYSEFNERVGKLAMALKSLGLEKTDVVGVIDWDSNVFLESFYAIPMCGATLHTINIRYPPELVYYTMQAAKDRFVIIRDEFLPMVEKMKDKFSFVKSWIVYSDSGKMPETTMKNVYNYSELMSKDYSVEFPEVPEDTRATLFFTSGTTGMPKGVYFTHRQIVLHAMSLTMSLSDEPVCITPGDVVMPIVPMFHVHSWGFPQLILLKGLKYVLTGRFDFDKIPRIMEKEKDAVSSNCCDIEFFLHCSSIQVEALILL